MVNFFGEFRPTDYKAEMILMRPIAGAGKTDQHTICHFRQYLQVAGQSSPPLSPPSGIVPWGCYRAFSGQWRGT